MNNVFLKVKELAVNNTFELLLTLVLITIPLHYRYNSISVILLTAFSIYRAKENKFKIQSQLLFPVALYCLMFLSLFWTIDFDLTFQALLKEITLVLLPFSFFMHPISAESKNRILIIYAYSIFFFSIGVLLLATYRFYLNQDSSVFFYHGLVTKDVNAIHVSCYCTIAFFIFINKFNKTNLDKMAIALLLVMIFLLSSKNIIVVFILLLFVYMFFNRKSTFKKVYLYLGFILFSATLILFFNKIKERFEIEIKSNVTSNSINESITSKGLVYNVSIYDAWNKEKFSGNDYFPGTALRVYQIRIFIELLLEENIFFNGYGLNASWGKIKQKRIEHNLHKGYESFNFHNQYIQNFAELGVFGLILLIIIVGLTLKNAIKSKDFIHFSFAILMISLFLTESFLWRQRGVVFFITMYCLFNSKTLINNSIKEKPNTI